MRRCSGCFEQIDENITSCPFCGYVEGSFSGDSQCLVPGTVLSEMYTVGKVLKADQTYVTYAGWHNISKCRIAIKEYLPRELVARVPGSTFVMPSDSNREASFDEGFQAFVNEAKRIYREGGNVQLYDCIAENNTSYMIMEFTEKDCELLCKPVSAPVLQQQEPLPDKTPEVIKVEKKKPEPATSVPNYSSNQSLDNGILQKLSLIPMWLKILVPVLLVAIVISVCVISGAASKKNKKPVVESTVNSDNASGYSATDVSEMSIKETETTQTSETTKETQIKTEWKLIDNDYYYYIDDKMATGWTSIEDHMYYLNPETGAMVIGWQEIDGSWYFFCKAGYIVTGWQQIGDSWFYFTADGKMMTGWQEIGGNWFYFEDDGIMQTGFHELEGNTYYFDPNGRLRTGWMKIDDEMYFFDKDGIMFTGTRIISGIEFTFEDDGRCVNPPD